MNQFITDKLLVQLSQLNIEVDEVIEKEEANRIDISFKNSNLRFISAPMEYEGLHNCINIYHSESSKNGYWWNHKLKYESLAEVLLNFHKA